MIEFLKRLFGQSVPSSSTAKERLRLVLMTDHLELAPEMIDAMKRDLVDVISRYVEVDRDKIDVTFEQQDKALAMLANIPILGVNRSGAAAPERAVAVAAAGKPPEETSERPAAPAIKRRRRRRKKSSNGASVAAAPEPIATG